MVGARAEAEAKRRGLRLSKPTQKLLNNLMETEVRT